jgi:hypothetical protein
VPHPETTNLGPSSISALVLRAMGAVELLRSNGPSNFNRQTSLFVFLNRKKNIVENTEIILSK